MKTILTYRIVFSDGATVFSAGYNILDATRIAIKMRKESTSTVLYPLYKEGVRPILSAEWSESNESFEWYVKSKLTL